MVFKLAPDISVTEIRIVLVEQCPLDWESVEPKDDGWNDWIENDFYSMSLTDTYPVYDWCEWRANYKWLISKISNMKWSVDFHLVISFPSILDPIWVMSLNQVDLTPDTSYEFEDQNERIRVAFYVTGAVKVKDCDIVIDTDVLELHLPSMWHSFSSLRNIEYWPFFVDDDEWIFQLFEHVYSDQSTTTEEINAAQTRTTIEISLLKQQPRTIWPQLHSYNSTPRTPQRPDPKARSSISTLPDYQLSTKKLSAVFSETSSTAQWFLALTQVSSCKVQFNETNFTLTFQTRLAKAFLSQWNFPIVSSFSEEKFLTEHGVSSTTPLQLLIRVKERITPTECSYNFTPAGIAIFLKKANCNSPKWLRLEANEYLEMQTPVKSSLITSGSLINTNMGEAIESQRWSSIHFLILFRFCLDTSIGPSPRYSNLSTETRQVECIFRPQFRRHTFFCYSQIRILPHCRKASHTNYPLRH